MKGSMTNHELSENNLIRRSKILSQLIVRISFPIFIIVFFLGIFAYLFYLSQTRENMSSSESVLVSIIIALTSIFITWYIGNKSVRKEVKEGLQGETKKAYRRVKIMKESAEKLNDMLDSRLGIYKYKKINEQERDVLLEIFRSAKYQLDNIIVHLNASIADWEDIIPIEVENYFKGQTKIKEIIESMNKQKEDLFKQIDEVRKAKEKDSIEKTSEINILAAKIKALETETDSKLTAVDPLFTAASGTLSYKPNAYSINDHNGIAGIETLDILNSAKVGGSFGMTLDSDVINNIYSAGNTKFPISYVDEPKAYINEELKEDEAKSIGK